MSVLGEAVRALPKGTFADVHESPDAYLVVLDVPGVTRDETTVEAATGVLEISATRSSAIPDGYDPVRTERSGGVEVTLPLPPDASEADLEWEFERGVLTVTVQKTDRSGEERAGPGTGASG
jgi:HSP20 family molecular chaperone IbpA